MPQGRLGLMIHSCYLYFPFPSPTSITFYYCCSSFCDGNPSFWSMNYGGQGFGFPSELASLPYSMAKMVSLALKIMTSHKRADSLAFSLV